MYLLFPIPTISQHFQLLPGGRLQCPTGKYEESENLNMSIYDDVDEIFELRRIDACFEQLSLQNLF